MKLMAALGLYRMGTVDERARVSNERREHAEQNAKDWANSGHESASDRLRRKAKAKRDNPS